MMAHAGRRGNDFGCGLGHVGRGCRSTDGGALEEACDGVADEPVRHMTFGSRVEQAEAPSEDVEWSSQEARWSRMAGNSGSGRVRWKQPLARAKEQVHRARCSASAMHPMRREALERPAGDGQGEGGSDRGQRVATARPEGTHGWAHHPFPRHLTSRDAPYLACARTSS